MAENIRFLAARCRNDQSRRGPEFLRDLSQRAGLPLDELRLLDPTQAVTLRREIDQRIALGVKAGTVRRQSGLSLAEATRLMEALCATQPDRPVYVFLLHAEHFPLIMPLSLLLSAWRAVLELDGDTVTVVTPDLEDGLAVDIWSPDDNTIEYQLDTWGSFCEHE